MSEVIAPKGHYFRVTRGNGYLGRSVFVELMRKRWLVFDESVAMDCAICNRERNLDASAVRRNVEESMRRLLRETLQENYVDDVLGNYPPKRIGG